MKHGGIILYRVHIAVHLLNIVYVLVNNFKLLVNVATKSSWNCSKCIEEGRQYVALSRSAFRKHMQVFHALDLKHVDTGRKGYDEIVQLSGPDLSKKLKRAKINSMRPAERRQYYAELDIQSRVASRKHCAIVPVF